MLVLRKDLVLSMVLSMLCRLEGTGTLWVQADSVIMPMRQPGMHSVQRIWIRVQDMTGMCRCRLWCYEAALTACWTTWSVLSMTESTPTRCADTKALIRSFSSLSQATSGADVLVYL